MHQIFDQIADDIWTIPGIMAVEDVSDEGVFGMCVVFMSNHIHVSQLDALYELFEDVEVDILDGNLCAWVYYESIRKIP